LAWIESKSAVRGIIVGLVGIELVLIPESPPEQLISARSDALPAMSSGRIAGYRTSMNSSCG